METLAVYDTRAAEYGAKFASDRPYPRLESFLTRPPPAGRLLDLGCGVGTSAARMRDAGYEVVALDASAGMVAEAATRYGLNAIQGSFDDIPRLGRFDGIWAHFSLLHAARADLPRHLAALHTALRPGAPFLIGMKSGDGEARDALGRRYTYVTEAELSGLLREAGFTLRDTETGAAEGLDGTVAPWVIMTADA